MKTQQPTTAHTPTCFLSLPGELRNKIYELIVLREEPIDSSHRFGQEDLTPGLLCANKTVHREASEIFYGQNRFYFARFAPEDALSFLEQIGEGNAGRIRHIIIDFPRFIYLDSGDLALTDESDSTLASIQRLCANLSTLTTCLFSTHAMEFRLNGLDNYKLASGALKRVDARFRAFAFIQHIILEVFEHSQNDYIRNLMESYGWTINIIRYE